MSVCTTSNGGGGGGGVGGTLGSTDNAVLRASGIGGGTAQGSDLVVANPASSVTALSSAGGNRLALPSPVHIGGAAGLRLQDSSGELDLRNSADTEFTSIRTLAVAARSGSATNAILHSDKTQGLMQAQDYPIAWYSGSTAGSGTRDLVAERGAAGILKISGAAGAAGTLQFGTFSVIGAEVVAGYLLIKDHGGTDRKLAVVA